MYKIGGVLCEVCEVCMYKIVYISVLYVKFVCEVKIGSVLGM